jgi:hypothetical protein
MAMGENPGVDRTKANWVDIATFIVLLLTLVAVALYTWEAMVAIRLTRQALERDFRPYIRPVPYDRSIALYGGRPIQIDVRLANLGRQPTRVTSRGSVIYSESHLDMGSPRLSELPAKFIWPGDSSDKEPHVVINSDEALDDKQRDDMNEGRGWLYVNVQVKYEQYMTRICYEYPFVAHALVLGNPKLCSDPSSNCVDADCR